MARRNVIERYEKPAEKGLRIFRSPYPPHPRPVHNLEQGPGVVHDGGEELPLLLLVTSHRRGHLWLQVAPGLDVNVDVGDAGQSLQEENPFPAFFPSSPFQTLSPRIRAGAEC